MSRWTRRYTPWLCVLSLAAACGGGDASPTTSGVLPSTTGTTSPSTTTTTSVPSGVTVDVTTADDDGATAIIGIEGGTLVAESGGLTYTLEIPGGALLSPVPITMTPIAAISLTEPVEGGVVFAPDGLLLTSPALLTVTGGATAESLVGFGFGGAGENLHMIPLVPGPDVVVPVAHFSGVGVTPAVEAFLGRLRSVEVNGLVNALHHEIARFFVEHRATAGDAAWEAQMAEFITRAGEVTSEALAAALIDPLALGAGTTSEVLALVRTMALLGIEVELPVDELLALLDAADQGLLRDCAAGGIDPLAATNALLKTERLRQLLGVEDDQGVADRLEQCRVVITAQPTIAWGAINALTGPLSDPERHDMILSAGETPLGFAADELTFPGFCPGGCTYTDYRWEVDITLDPSDFSTTDTCWTGAPWFTAEGVEPTLHIEYRPSLTVRRLGLAEAPSLGAGGDVPATTADVTLGLSGVVAVPTGNCRRDSTADGLLLDDSWGWIEGSSVEVIPFGITTLSWTRTANLGGRESYTVTTEVVFSIMHRQ